MTFIQWLGACFTGLLTTLKPYYGPIVGFISGFVVEELRRDAKDATNAAQETKDELESLKAHNAARAYNSGLADDVARQRLRNLH